MVYVLYDDLGVEIEGSESALRELSERLLKCDDATQIVLADPTELEARGLGSAKLIKLSIRPGPVTIDRLNRDLSISGSKEKLAILAQNISWLADNVKSSKPSKIRDHIHVEYSPDHFFLAQGSLPLIVTRLD